MNRKEPINRKVAIVTGGTHGIGFGIAQRLLGEDYFVVTCARHKPTTEFAKEVQKNHLFIPCDIGDSESRESLVSETLAHTGRIDVLINNAGIAPPERKDILEANEQSFELVMKINLEGPYFLTQNIANVMIKLQQQQIYQYSPSIINISSISSFTSSTARGEYCISKAGMSMMTKLYADRLAEYSIPVYEIQPGIIWTPMTEAVKEKYDKLIAEGLLPIKRWGKSEDIAEACYTLAEGKIPYATGQVLNIDGGFHLRRL